MTHQRAASLAAARFLRHLLRHEFRHALDDDVGATLSRAFGHGAGHLLDVAVARIVENENLGHDRLLM